MRIQELTQTNLRINAGNFIFKPKIFDYIREGDELVNEPFHRLLEKRQLMAYPYDGFFAAMDTFKDKQRLDDIVGRGPAPWELWKKDKPDVNGRPLFNKPKDRSGIKRRG
jgi:glucose-1-phosphate cytidylyltransferase